MSQNQKLENYSFEATQTKDAIQLAQFQKSTSEKSYNLNASETKDNQTEFVKKQSNFEKKKHTFVDIGLHDADEVNSKQKNQELDVKEFDKNDPILKPFNLLRASNSKDNNNSDEDDDDEITYFEIKGNFINDPNNSDDSSSKLAKYFEDISLAKLVKGSSYKQIIDTKVLNQLDNLEEFNQVEVPNDSKSDSKQNQTT